MTRNWGAESLLRSARTAPTWQVRNLALYANEYDWLATLWNGWSLGFTFSGKSAVGTGIRIDTVAPSLMPYPRAGWGFITLASSIQGAGEEPQSTPQLLATGTLASSTNLPPAGSLQRLLDERSVQVMRPPFARLKP